jgi:hypothetical protein
MMHLKSVQIVGDEDGTVQQVLVVVLDNDGKSSSFTYPGKVDTSVSHESNGALSIRVYVEPPRKNETVDVSGPRNAARR